MGDYWWVVCPKPDFFSLSFFGGIVAIPDFNSSLNPFLSALAYIIIMFPFFAIFLSLNTTEYIK